MSEAVICQQDARGVVRLTLNQPASFNALGEEMLTALQAGVDRVAADEGARVVVIAAAGKAFCPGHNLREMVARPELSYYQALFTQCSRLMLSLIKLPVPVIARVHGIATAAGCQLVAACDMAVAAEGTRFGVNGVNIGLFCATPMVALTRAIAPRVVFEMLATGRFVETGEALSLGLITRAAPANELAEVTEALATTMAAKLPAALQLGKRAFRAQAGLPVDQAYAAMSAVMVANMALEDTAEGIAAFLDKRPPNWPAA